MSIQRVINAAFELQRRLEEIGLPFCFIGGIAVQRWGEPRLTVDADATVLSDWAQDERLHRSVLSNKRGRLYCGLRRSPSNRFIKPFAFLLTLFLGTPFLFAAEQSLDTFTISPGEVTKAGVFNGADGQVRLDMALITGKRHEFAEFTRRNLDKQVKLIVNQDVVSEPVIRGQILGGSLEIIVRSLETGHALAKALMSKQPPPEAPEQEPTLGGAPVIKTPRDELVSQLEAAIETRDKAAFERCCNFSGTNQDSRQSASKLEDEIFAWPTHYVCAWERTEKGNMHGNVNGKFFTLNGDWTFFIGIYRLKPASNGLPGSKGFSFPAGIADGKPFVLLPVEEKP